ncbi:MAG: glycerophosphodiester phosphodiesterase family protein [Phyllobacterium sp.]|uniref:glycerophosphodiester phosphodiesterase family protein n=1 Tax=Phyllobacterium sp. TaxID=1871046 RepID=UPI0030F2614B
MREATREAIAALLKVSMYFRVAFAYRMPFIATHLTVRLVTSAVFVPLIGLLLGIVVGFSGRSAMTDQDIAWLLMTPAGALTALAAIALGIAAAALDIALMMYILAIREQHVIPAIRQGFAFVVPRFPRIMRFSLGLLLRVLGIALPFVLAMAATAYLSLRDHDINYYLTDLPPRAMLAAAGIAALATLMGLVLLSKLTDWAFALQLVVGRGVRPWSAFKQSAALLQGRKLPLFRQIVVWVAFRILMAATIAALFGAAIGGVPSLLADSLRFIAGLTFFFLLVWGVMNAFVSALSNGALARLLLSEFLEATGEEGFPATAAVGVSSGRRMSPWIILAPALACVAAGLVLTDGLLSRIGSPQTVEIIAHRGAAGERPENTMAAVLKAINDGADWVEIDVQETADGEVIVAHDSDFMKSAGVELKVWNATMADIARIDVGSSFDPAYAAERTPTLRDILLAARGKSRVMIELKYYGHNVDLEERVARLVEETGMTDKIAIISLKLPMIEKMRGLRPGWRTGVLAARAVGDLSKLDTNFIAVNTGQVSVGLIKRCKANGKRLYAWTVDEPVTMSRMISMGVDGLITNKPALARQVMERRNALSVPERLLLWVADSFGIGSFRLVANERDA